MPAQGPGPRAGVADAQIARVQVVRQREQTGPSPDREVRDPLPEVRSEQATVVRRHIADERQTAPAPDAVQRAVEHSQPPVAAEILGDGGLGVAHQAPKLLPGHLDVAAFDGMRLPAPPAPVSGQADGSPAGEDRRAPHRYPLEARRPVVRDEHRAGGPAPRQPRADVALRAGVGQARLRPHRAIDEGHPARPGRHLRPVRLERAAVLDQLAGERVRRLVLGLDPAP